MSTLPTDLRNVAQTSSRPLLVDRFGRVHRSLRLSVTDQCNIRCQYCMPAEGVEFLPAGRLLGFEQLERFVRVLAACGVRNVRITGGEPLLRRDLHDLVARLVNIDGIEEMALTSNGMLLAERVDALAEAGLQRINVSLDTLSESTFQRLSRRRGLHRVLEGIEAACRDPRLQVKLNALVLRDINLEGLFDLLDFAIQRGLTLRFIEFMPLDADRDWSTSRMVSGEELRSKITQRYGPLERVSGSDPSQPSSDYVLTSSGARVGFIDSISRPFCGSCDRLRLTADGKIRNCLFGQEEWDVSELLRADPFDAERLEEVVRVGIAGKHAAHGIAEPGFHPPSRAMYQIGG